MKKSLTVISILFLFGAVIFSGCAGSDIDDEEYTLVEKYCKYPAHTMGDLVVMQKNPSDTYLTPECKAILNEILPFDEEAFALAPEGLKERLLEAFQALVAYPLVFPKDGAIFGVKSKHQGAIPAGFYTIFEEEENYNKSIFNYVLNKFETITYQSKSSVGNRTAEYNSGLKQVTIFNNFWKNNMAQFINPIYGASVLVHEARHGDGFMHTFCAGKGGSECDAELAGPYGFGAIYQLMAVHGSFTDQDYALPPIITTLLGGEICHALKAKVVNIPAELDEFIRPLECARITGQNFLEWEGLQK